MGLLIAGRKLQENLWVLKSNEETKSGDPKKTK